MYSKELEAKKKSLKLSERQRDILVGILLGDGHLETKNNGRTYRLKIEHTSKQSAYVNWLYNEFKQWVNTPPKTRSRFTQLRSVSGIYERMWFNTLSSGSLRFYAQQFYKERVKVVPAQIKKWLSPLALAVWYMDDGSIKSHAHKTVLLNTHSFSKEDIKRLQHALEDRYKIKSKMRKQKEGYQIYLLSETIDLFLSLIEPYIIPSMRYKIPKIWLTQLPKQ